MKNKLFYLGLLFSSIAVAEVKLQPLSLPKMENVEQLSIDDKQQLLILNQQGELWRNGENTPILTALSTQIQPVSQHNKIAAADKQGNFLLWQNGKVFYSDIKLSPEAGMAILPLGVIAVQRENGKNHLVRLEPQEVGQENDSKSAVKIVAVSATEVLPDMQPVQVNFDGDNANGHIAVLAKPDSQTYQHGVLGDGIEAAELQFLERHNLQPLATALSPSDLVFEANRLAVLPADQGHQIVSVLSGNGEGGRAVIVGLKNGKLSLEKQSQPLPDHRWQSPFVFNGKLYAVQMPHLAGRLVEYQSVGNQLQEKTLATGLSNHAIGTRETNLTAVTADFAVIPQVGYRAVSILDKQGKLTALEQKLPARIVKTVANQHTAYLLLDNGEVWQVKEEK